MGGGTIFGYPGRSLTQHFIAPAVRHEEDVQFSVKSGNVTLFNLKHLTGIMYIADESICLVNPVWVNVF